MGKLREAICPGCRKPIGRHDLDRHLETQGQVVIIWHRKCWEAEIERR